MSAFNIPPEVRKGDPITAKMFQDINKAILERTPRSSNTIGVSQGANGYTLQNLTNDASRPALSEFEPFEPIFGKDDDTITVAINPSYIVRTGKPLIAKFQGQKIAPDIDTDDKETYNDFEPPVKELTDGKWKLELEYSPIESNEENPPQLEVKTYGLSDEKEEGKWILAKWEIEDGEIVKYVSYTADGIEMLDTDTLDFLDTMYPFRVYAVNGGFAVRVGYVNDVTKGKRFVVGETPEEDENGDPLEPDDGNTTDKEFPDLVEGDKIVLKIETDLMGVVTSAELVTGEDDDTKPFQETTNSSSGQNGEYWVDIASIGADGEINQHFAGSFDFHARPWQNLGGGANAEVFREFAEEDKYQLRSFSPRVDPPDQADDAGDDPALYGVNFEQHADMIMAHVLLPNHVKNPPCIPVVEGYTGQFRFKNCGDSDWSIVIDVENGLVTDNSIGGDFEALGCDFQCDCHCDCHPCPCTPHPENAGQDFTSDSIQQATGTVFSVPYNQVFTWDNDTKQFDAPNGDVLKWNPTTDNWEITGATTPTLLGSTNINDPAGAYVGSGNTVNIL